MLESFFNKKLKYNKWYSFSDDLKILVLDESNVKIDYKDSIIYIDIQSILISELLLMKMIKSKLNGDEEDEDDFIDDPNEIDLTSDSFLKDRSVEELNDILNLLIEEEDYAGCSKVKKLIDTKKKKNS